MAFEIFFFSVYWNIFYKMYIYQFLFLTFILFRFKSFNYSYYCNYKFILIKNSSYNYSKWGNLFNKIPQSNSFLYSIINLFLEKTMNQNLSSYSIHIPFQHILSSIWSIVIKLVIISISNKFLSNWNCKTFLRNCFRSSIFLSPSKNIHSFFFFLQTLIIKIHSSFLSDFWSIISWWYIQFSRFLNDFEWFLNDFLNNFLHKFFFFFFSFNTQNSYKRKYGTTCHRSKRR